MSLQWKGSKRLFRLSTSTPHSYFIYSPSPSSSGGEEKPRTHIPSESPPPALCLPFISRVGIIFDWHEPHLGRTSLFHPHLPPAPPPQSHHLHQKVHSPADWRLYLKTSQRTSLLGSLRKGSRNMAAGRRYMSLLEPSAWKVLEPSKFHSGRSGEKKQPL